MTHSTAAAATSMPSVGSADAPLKALHPVDGLFLRAEHLAAIQDGARAVSRAVARAGGAGVAYGCTATYRGGRVTVSQGLAIAPTGQPLLVVTPLSEPVPTETAPYFVVELRPDTEFTGTPEQVFGRLCEDPCAGGETFQPYVVDVARIVFRQPSLTLPAWTGSQWRSAVASAYFAEERKAAPPLRLESPDWAAGTDPPAAGGVPVGLLIRDGSDWRLDMWAARRDRMETPPERGWAQRFGRRPQDVFLAQVLQLQAQLADLNVVPGRVRSRIADSVTLPEHFVELPPAGYLPVDPTSPVSVNEQVTRLFGPGVDLRFCTARPDEVGLALERARNLDRIPLSAASAGDRPKVDILVPDGVPATRGAVSSVRFAGGKVTVTSGEEHPYHGLARLSHAPGSPVTLAFAAEGTLESRGEGLWAAMRLGRSPLELRPGMLTLVQATIAARQTRTKSTRKLGQALQRFDLFGQLECLDNSTDPASGFPTMEGRFRGQLLTRLDAQRSESSVAAAVRLSVLRTGSSEHVLRLETTGPQLTETLDVHVIDRATGRTVSFNTGETDRVTSGIAAELDEIAANLVHLSQFRWAAERGLAALEATDIPMDAVTLLFAGAGPPSTRAAYATPHDWIFFTRRHLLDCAPIQTPTPAALRLDLYVEDRAEPPEPDREPTKPTGAPPASLRYVSQLAWDADTDLLSSASGEIIDGWRQFHKAAQVTGAMVWAGGAVTEDRARRLVEQVVQRMQPGASGVTIEVRPGPPEIPTTPGSSGAVVVSVSTRDVPPPATPPSKAEGAA